ncbi:MAG: hypothetical protein V4662_17830 [Verrucomicrobiota bacterium]
MCLSLTDAVGELPVHGSVTMSDKERRFFDALHWACSNMLPDYKLGANVRGLCREWSTNLKREWRFEIGPEQLRKWLYRYRDHGDKGLRNGRLAGKPLEKRKLHPRVIDEFWGIYLAMKDKASKEAAWLKLITRLVEGEVIGEVLTWQRLHNSLYPERERPAVCPWSNHNPPPGWSLSNFTTQQVPSAIAKELALRGMGAAKALLAKTAGIRIDWSTLRIGECLMIDDHDVDFRCLVDGQFVRLRLIVLRDVRTRRHLAYVVRPRIKDEDGTERSITRRDVMHLMAGFLWNYGLPRDYTCYLHCERAAATISVEDEARLFRVTKGLLKIDRTAIFQGVVKMSSYRERGGTPTGKPQIESGFRLLDLELAHLRGATGSNYTKKHGEHEARLSAAKKLVERARDLPVEQRNKLAEMVKSGDVKFPFLSIWEAHQEIADAMQRMDARDWHEMEGFLKVEEFRTSQDSTLYLPLNPELAFTRSNDEQEMIREYLVDYPESLQNRMKSWGRSRRESSVECWKRLGLGAAFVRISHASLFELLLDVHVKPWSGTGEVMLEIQGEKIFFRGQIDAKPNQMLRFNFNADEPRAVWALDEAGHCLGTLKPVERVHYHDTEGKRALADFKATVLQGGFHEVRRYELSNPADIENFTDDAALAQLMTNLEGDQGRIVPVATLHSETSAALLAEVERSMTLPKPEDARRELAAKKRRART